MNNDQTKILSYVAEAASNLQTLVTQAQAGSDFCTAVAQNGPGAPITKAQFDTLVAAASPLLAQFNALNAQLSEFGKVA